MGVCSRAGALGVVTVAIIAGCGGRTSTLDSDVYGTGISNVGDDDDDSGSGGSIASGGMTSIGVAGKPGTGATTGVGGAIGTGAAPTGTGGKTASGADPSLSVAPCQAYCPGYGVECQSRLNGQECYPACQSEVNSFGPKCQRLGIQALKCLTPFFKADRMTCDADVNRGLTKCGKIVANFEQCKESVSPSKPPTMTTPPSMPTMPTGPHVDINTCPADGSSSGNNCLMNFQCSGGPYVVFCDGNSASGFSCTCVSPNGTINSRMFMGSLMDVCRTAANPLCVQ